MISTLAFKLSSNIKYIPYVLFLLMIAPFSATYANQPWGYENEISGAVLVNDHGDAVFDGSFESRLGNDIQAVTLNADVHRALDDDFKYEFMLWYSHMITDDWEAQIGMRLQGFDSFSFSSFILGLNNDFDGVLSLDIQLYAGDESRFGLLLAIDKEFELSEKWSIQPEIDAEWALVTDADDETNGLTSLVVGVDFNYQIHETLSSYINISYYFEDFQSDDPVEKYWQFGVGITKNF